MSKKKDNDRELSLMLKESAEGTTEELKELLPSIDLSPEISDAKVKQAILGISPMGMQKLYSQFGQAQVMKFISDFSEGRRF